MLGVSDIVTGRDVTPLTSFLCTTNLGQGIVTQEFWERKWKAASIDSSEGSNATIRRDIETLKPEELIFVPDFMWFSPQCQTHLRLAGGTHRSLKNGELEKSPESRDHNSIFAKMVEIMHWCKKRASHLIVVIENPMETLKDMPLMINLTETFGLHSTQVHYCAFGRDEMKSTMIWTNDYRLMTTLSQFTCKNKCPYHGQNHPANVREDGSRSDFSVHSKFYQDHIQDHVATLPDKP